MRTCASVFTAQNSTFCKERHRQAQYSITADQCGVAARGKFFLLVYSNASKAQPSRNGTVAAAWRLLLLLYVCAADCSTAQAASTHLQACCDHTGDGVAATTATANDLDVCLAEPGACLCHRGRSLVHHSGCSSCCGHGRSRGSCCNRRWCWLGWDLWHHTAGRVAVLWCCSHSWLLLVVAMHQAAEHGHELFPVKASAGCQHRAG